MNARELLLISSSESLAALRCLKAESESLSHEIESFIFHAEQHLKNVQENWGEFDEFSLQE